MLEQAEFAGQPLQLDPRGSRRRNQRQANQVRAVAHQCENRLHRRGIRLPEIRLEETAPAAFQFACLDPVVVQRRMDHAAHFDRCLIGGYADQPLRAHANRGQREIVVAREDLEAAGQGMDKLGNLGQLAAGLLDRLNVGRSLGQADHREVVGYTKDLDAARYRVFYNVEDVKAFDWSRYAVVKVIFQTTINSETFAEHVAEIRRCVADTRIADTICYATKENQDALRVLCDDPTIDAIVVIGGKNSKNTKELAHIAAGKKPTFLVGTAAELDPAKLAGAKKVGVSAGASTPDYDVDAVVAKLASL